MLLATAAPPPALPCCACGLCLLTCCLGTGLLLLMLTEPRAGPNWVPLQGEGAMTAVFWTGLAVWLLFAVAPVRYFLGLVPRRRR